MKIDPNKKYRFRCGEPARIICTDAPGDFPIVALDEKGSPSTHNEKGRLILSGDSPWDLIEVREPREFWIIETETGEARVYPCQQIMGTGMTPYPNQIRVREIID